MGYGFGAQCPNGGFQFGVWEFCPPDHHAGERRLLQPLLGTSRPLLPHHVTGRSSLLQDEAGGAAMSSDAWHLFNVLERVRWVNVDLEVSALIGCFYSKSSGHVFLM